MTDKKTPNVTTLEEQSGNSAVPPARMSHRMARVSLQNSDEGSRHHDSLQIDKVDTQYPPLWKTVLIISGLFMGVFLVALDQTIIGTAIPKITDEFKTIQVIERRERCGRQNRHPPPLRGIH